MKKQPYRRAYLLTVWFEIHANGEQPNWRFCLEDPKTGQRRVFGNAIALVAALQTGFIGTEGNDPAPLS